MIKSTQDPFKALGLKQKTGHRNSTTIGSMRMKTPSKQPNLNNKHSVASPSNHMEFAEILTKLHVSVDKTDHDAIMSVHGTHN